MAKARRRRLIGTTLASAVVFAAAAAHAEPPAHRLVFDERYRPFQWPDAVQTAATFGVYAYVEFGLEYPSEGRWHGPILFDAALRDAVRAETRAGRDRADVLSDITWYVPMGLPWAEGLILPLVTDRWNYEVAFQLTALNAQATSVVALLTRAGHKFVARERPDVQPCLKDPEYNEQCFAGSFADFPSGHVSAAMLGAGLSCAHHAYLPLVGGGPAEAAICATATTLGVVNGISRMAVDRHYASDVIVGAALGWGVGFGMPWLLHYRWRRASPASAWTVTPLVSSSTLGLSAFGLW